MFLAHNTRALGKIKLFKLLYLLDFEHFRQTGRSITGMEYRAWKMGPAPIELAQQWDDLDPDLGAAVTIEHKRVIDHERDEVIPRVDFDPNHCPREDFDAREFRVQLANGTLEFITLLTGDMLRAAMECAAGADDTTLAQERAIRDRLGALH